MERMAFTRRSPRIIVRSWWAVLAEHGLRQVSFFQEGRNTIVLRAGASKSEITMTKEEVEMAQELIYTMTKSHWDNNLDWNPAESGKGVDTHIVSLPEGTKFARYSIDVEVASLASGCNVESAPEAGATGEPRILVRWWYNPFGKISYTLHVYAGAPEPVTILYGENNWVGKALDTLRQEQEVKIAGRGHVARKLFGRMMRMAGRDLERTFYAQPKSDSVTVNQDVAFGLMATIKYGAIGGTILFGLNKGYEVTGEFDAGGPLHFDDQLTISFRKR